MLLVIDDHKDTCRLLERLFQQHGMEARSAQSGDEALRILSQQIPELVIMDYDMPGMTGLDILREMRSVRTLAQTPVVMYSARATDGAVEEARQLGASCWIEKGGNGGTCLLRQVTNLLHDHEK